MRLTGSGVTRPVGVPRMPPGLVELMEGLTKDVLKHSPADVYEFCANHMRKLLEIRDGCPPDKPLTLEKKIARAQQKIRLKAEERCKIYDMEMKLLSAETAEREKMNVQKMENPTETIIDNSLKTQINHQIDQTEVRNIENPSVTITENSHKAPIHHEKELADALEVEIFHKVADVVQDLKKTEASEINKAIKKDTEIAEASNKLSDNINDYTEIETSHEDSKSSDIHLNFHENDVIVENESANTLGNVSDTIGVMDHNKSNIEDDMLGNDKDKSLVHTRIPRSTDATKESFADSVDIGHVENNDDVDVGDTNNDNVEEAENSAEEIVYQNIADALEVNAGNIGEVIEEIFINNGDVTVNGEVIETLKNTEGNITNIVEANKEMTDNGIKNVEQNLDKIEGGIEENLEEISEDVTKSKKENLVIVKDNCNGKVDETLDNLENIDNIAKVAGEDLSKLSEVNVDIIVDAVNENVNEPAKNSESERSAENIAKNAFMEVNNDEIANAINSIVDHVLEGPEEKNIVDAIEETVSDIYKASEEKVEDIINATNAKEIKDLDNTDVSEEKMENIVDVTNAEINEILEKSESHVVRIADAPKEYADDNTKASIANANNESDEVSNVKTSEEKGKVYVTEIVIKKADCGDTNGINNQLVNQDDGEASTGSESAVLNNDNGADEKRCITENAINDNQSDEEIDIDSAQKNKSADAPLETKEVNADKMSQDIKSSPNGIENIDSHVTIRNFEDADNFTVEKVPKSENTGDENIHKIPESSHENIDKKDASADNHDKDRETLLESPTLENIKSVIKSEISLEDVPNNESSEHDRFKRDLENISEAQEISEPAQPCTETLSIKKSNSLDSTISTFNDSHLELDTVKSSDESTQDNTQSHSNMDLETAAVTIQKVFRTFMFKSRGSTFDDTANEDSNLTDEENDKEELVDFSAAPANLNKERRTLGIHRMDTVLQTVNEEKSLSLSTDDSSTLSSAATVIQAHVRGFLVRNRLNSNKTTSSNSLVNSDGPSTTSFEADNDQHKVSKTVLNIHIVPGDQYLSRDESMITSMDLSLDGSPPSSTNLHPLGYDKSEPRKQLKREDAIQSVSPPSNNSGKLSEDVDSMKEVLTNDANSEQKADESTSKNQLQHDANVDTLGTPLTKSTTIETVVETQIHTSDESGSPEPEKELSELQKKRKRNLSKMGSDESDVVTPFLSEDKGVPRDSDKTAGLLHSGEFHDVVLPTKVTRSDTSIVREFKNVLVYFLLLNNS